MWIDRRNGVDLDQVSMMQLGDRYYRPRRPRVAKRCGVDRIELRPIFYINNVRGYLQYALR